MQLCMHKCTVCISGCIFLKLCVIVFSLYKWLCNPHNASLFAYACVNNAWCSWWKWIHVRLMVTQQRLGSAGARVCVLICVDNRWCLVPCCVCVRTAHRVWYRLSFHEAIGMNEPFDPWFSWGHAPPLRTHVTSLCPVLTELSCVFPSSRSGAAFFFFKPYIVKLFTLSLCFDIQVLARP